MARSVPGSASLCRLARAPRARAHPRAHPRPHLQEHGLVFLETSAKTALNVEEAFINTAR